MKIALITDTHFGVRSDSPAFAKHQQKFYDDIFFPYLEKNNIKNLIHLGDCFDRRKFINFKTLNDFRNKFLLRLWDLQIDSHFIIGNHDTYYKNTNDINAQSELFTTFDGKHEPYIYHKPKVVEFDGFRILMVPWICPENAQETKMILEQESADLICGHLEVKGFEMHKGVINNHGLESTYLKRFEKVFTGHFHKKSDNGHVYYLGTPYEMVWSDYKCPKGFHIFDTETRELTRILNPYTIHRKIYYNDEKNDYKEFDYSEYKDTFIKVIVEKKTDYYMFDRFLDGFYKMTNVHDLKVIEDYSDLDANSVDDDIAEKAEDTSTLLDNYIDQLSTKLDKGRLKTLMRSLYTEANDIDV